MTDDEDIVYRDFFCGSLRYIDAIARLESLGYSAMEAKQLVSEWADDTDNQQQWEAEGRP